MQKQPYLFPSCMLDGQGGREGRLFGGRVIAAADFVSRQDALRNKFIGAMMYPCILLLGAVAAVVFIMTSWCRASAAYWRGSGSRADADRIGISDGITEHYLVIIALVTVAVVGSWRTCGVRAGGSCGPACSCGCRPSARCTRWWRYVGSAACSARC
jgi:hypothetical protein